MPRRRKEPRSEIKERGMKVIKPMQRNAANARERSRMRVLSKAFSKLKTTLPWVPADTKLSKLDTLRLASSYIAHLAEMLDSATDEVIKSSHVHPLNLTWPFSFSGRYHNDEDAPDENAKDNADDSGDDNGQTQLLHYNMNCKGRVTLAPDWM